MEIEPHAGIGIDLTDVKTTPTGGIGGVSGSRNDVLGV